MKAARIVNRLAQRDKLKQLRQAVRLLERHAALEFKRGYELGGVTMKKAIQQAQAEQTATKLDGE